MGFRTVADVGVLAQPFIIVGYVGGGHLPLGSIEVSDPTLAASSVLTEHKAQ